MNYVRVYLFLGVLIGSITSAFALNEGFGLSASWPWWFLLGLGEGIFIISLVELARQDAD